MNRLGVDFFRREPVVCARELIGCTLQLGETAGIIVETEAYAAENDPACHTWSRKGARNFVFRHEAGTAYVYLNYGMHWLFNLLVKGGGLDGFVLVRALEPIEGLDVMRRRRKRQLIEELCNGPAKLTQALGINGKHHEASPLRGYPWRLAMWKKAPEITFRTRIGISKAVDLPWRFLLRGNKFASIP